MKSAISILALILATAAAGSAHANLLDNGNLDRTQATEIVPGFFLPKPQVWVNVGTRAISGPYEDELSSEPWAGPAPTPVTTDGNLNPPHPEGCGGPDCGVFFKPFTGSVLNGAATAHLYQDVPGTPGLAYTLTGWAGAESNALMAGAEFALEFRDGASTVIGGVALNLLPTLFVANGQPFNYKEYTLVGVAPPGTVSVRARASMLDALSNPMGGGQAFVVDDFTLTSSPDAVPEPATGLLVGVGALGAAWARQRRGRSST